MTVEFIDDHLVAHLDRDHVAYANHPIINKERTYFAFQVDDKPAAFDNIQILQARKSPKFEPNLEHLKSIINKYPFKKPLKQEYEIRKTNAHEWFYQRQEEYRSLVKKVEELDQNRKERFPSAFRSHKEIKKKALALRKKLNKEDPKYKELLHATHRAKRAIEAYLIEQNPEVAEYPNSRRKAAIEKLRSKHLDSIGYKKLILALEFAQKKLEKAYPRAFISDEEIKESRKAEHNRVKGDPLYKELQQARSDAYRAQENYLFTNDQKLTELKELLNK